MERPAAVVILLLLAAVPIAEAHLAGARPILQRGQFQRTVDLQPIDLTVLIDLILSSDQFRDPQRHLITHVLDPAVGRLYVEHREDASIAGDHFWAEWQIDRIIEYHDNNVNGRFEDATDTEVKVWRFTHYSWRLPVVQAVQLEDVAGTSIVWDGNLTGAPGLRVEIAAAGKDFADEGAIVRPQDVVVYLDVADMPERAVGSLFAVEFTVRARSDATFSFHEVEEVPTALLVDAPLRRAMLVWGGEAFLDGQEQVLGASIVDDRVEGANRTARVVLHLPTVDEGMHFVLTSGIEYATPSERAPMGGSLLALAAIAAALLLARRRRA